jgi:hypothetical protein
MILNSPPTTAQQQAIGTLLHMALKEMPLLCLEHLSEQAADLADALAELPLRMFSSEFCWTLYMNNLRAYQDKYPSREGIDYVAYLQRVQQA